MSKSPCAFATIVALSLVAVEPPATPVSGLTSPSKTQAVAPAEHRDASVHTGNKQVEMVENSQWVRLDYKRKITKGSALDFSFVADAPAGKYGRIVPTPEGQLAFENAPEKKIRLFGTNLTFTANFLPQRDADSLADYLAYCGHNTVRIHHHDTLLTAPQAPDSLTLNAESLDQLDYLFFKMKEKGLYITTDLYTNRRFKPGDNIPECTFYNKRQMKALIPLSRGAMENWKEFARRWMTHKNPYTELTWAEDPAFYCVNLINEEPLTQQWNVVPQLYTVAFKNYCETKGIPQGKVSNSDPTFRRFLHELQSQVLDEQINFLKNDLKLKALVTSLNCAGNIPLTLLRQRFDVVDVHQYFDHPHFVKKSWTMPYSYQQHSSILAMGHAPRYRFATRLFGKAYLITEFNFCSPNLFRAECGPLVGSYAALQGYSALYRFDWARSAEYVSQADSVTHFDAINDPMAQFSDRIAIAMFLRQDVDTASEAYAYAVPKDCIEQKLLSDFPADFTKLGLITAIGSTPAGTPSLPTDVTLLSPEEATSPDKLKNPQIAELWKRAINAKIAISITGQLQLNANTGTFSVATPRTASVTLQSGNLSAGALQVSNASCYQTITAISLDGKELSTSSSILLFQLTNIANTGDLYEDNSKKVLLKYGSLPLLVQKGSAMVGLTSTKPCQVIALNCDGEPYGEITGTLADGTYRFKVDTACFPGGVMVYHITR